MLFSLAPNRNLVLASSSPRRHELLSEWGIPFEIIRPKGAEPLPMEKESPLSFCARSAKAKAYAVYKERTHVKKSIILAADTIVALGNKIFGKPEDPEEALAMLLELSGKSHTVLTSCHLLLCDSYPPEDLAFTDQSLVHFSTYPRHVLENYVATKEPLDKAGAYAIQGKGAFLVDRLEGSWTTVVGLPLSLLANELLKRKLLLPASL